MGEAEVIGRLVYGTALAFYWSMAIICLYFAWSRPKTVARRATCIAVVLAIFGYVPAMRAYEGWQAQRYKHQAYAHFTKRCNENAGETINRVVENVEGIFIAKPRLKPSAEDMRDQYWMGDPYGHSEHEAISPAGTYLHDRGAKTVSSKDLTPIRGFAFVETVNPDSSSGSPYLRYTLKPRSIADATASRRSAVEPIPEPVDTLQSRFAITWEDISTVEDRKYWVAGGTLTVFDIQTAEVLGRRVGYVIDPQLGQITQGRAIWLHVNHIPGVFCPSFESHFYKNKEFVAKVLRPPRGEPNAN